MPFTTANRVQETTSTAGTGTVTLNGALAGFRTFNTDIGVGNTTSYVIFDPTANVWEAGIGTVLTSNTFGRTQVLSNSSGTTALISFAGNTSNIWCDYLAERSVTQFDVGTNANQIPLNQYLGRMAYQDYANALQQNILIDTNTTAVEPTLMLDFANAKTLDSRVTFTRSTTATYYDGKTSAIAEQNLFLQSQTFDNASWSKSNTTVTADATTAPDGTTTADSVIPTAVTQGHRVLQTVTVAGTWAFSYYVKANGYSKIGMWDSTVSGAYAAFNLSTGTVLDSGAGASSVTITALANSWYRVSFVATSSGTIAFSINVLDPAYTTGSINNSWLPDGTSGVYLWGAQLEQRPSATAYNATTTTVLTNYIPQLLSAPINTPRFDYNPTTFEPLGLLIEQSSTNIALYSNSVSGTGWSSNGGTVIQNYAIAPDGSQTASYFYGTVNPQRYQTTTVTASTTYTSSVYYKTMSAVSGSILTIGTDTVASSACTARFDLNTNTLIFSGSSVIGTAITAVGNGWYRASVTYTITAITSIANIVYIVNPSGYVQVLIWGAQLEALAFPTSYIATTSAQVTRGADSASMTGTNFSSWYNQGQGTMFADFTISSRNDSPPYRGVYSLAVANCRLDVLKTTSGIPPNATRSIAVGRNKEVAAYSSANQTITEYINGVNTATLSPVAAINNTASSLAIGRDDAFSPLSGTISKLVYYPKALSSAELQEMTS